jgi:hypothetical protein
MTRLRKTAAALAVGLIAVAVIDKLTIERRSMSSAVSLYLKMSDEYFSEPARQRTASVLCQNIPRKASYFDYQMVECQTSTPCGTPVSLIFLYSRISGAFIEPGQFQSRFARRCPEMLTGEALAEISAKP